MYWDIAPLLSHNKLFNYLLGNRGAGKSYGVKKYVIKNFLKKGKQFVLLRRYKTELKGDNVNKYFADIIENNEFPNTKFEIRGKTAYINDKIAGYFVALSTANHLKSTSFPLVDTIIFEEFIPEDKAVRYLPDEPNKFLSVCETIFRMRDNWKAIFIANAVTIVNPHFTFWNIRPRIDKRFTQKGDILIEIYDNEDFIQAKKKTRFGQLISGTAYGEYAINNKFLMDNSTFIEKRSSDCNFIGAFVYEGITYGYWVDYKQDKLFIDYKYNPDSVNIFTLTKDDHTPNKILISAVKNTRLVKTIRLCYEQGLIRFYDQQAKHHFMDYFSLIK